jgi:flavin reductase (DIM6/NTAB) family NADH-FMN oxidoreductase RutF
MKTKKRFYQLLSGILIGLTASCSTGEWRKIPPAEIRINPIKKFGDEWMALAVGKEGDMNAMTISWGHLGVLWREPTVMVYVASSRYTHSFMERNKYFTVIGFPEKYRSALQYLGTHSGRNGDKIKAAGLTATFTELGNPMFEEGNIVIECKILYSEVLDIQRAPEWMKANYDKKTGDGAHTMYVGQIINVWVK